MMRSTTRLLLLMSLLVTVAAPGRAQAPGELRRAMQQYFQQRLRAEVSLSEAQLEHILPRITRLEDAKRDLRRSRAETIRGLRHGLEQDATDEELQELLDRLDRAEADQRQHERSLLDQIEETLSSRQRVQLRLFIQHFRQEMQHRVQEFRGDRPREPRRRPRRDRP